MLVVMPSFWSRFVPEKSLAKVTAPTWVRISATVAASELVQSPFSGLRAAAVHWTLLGEHVMSGGQDGGTSTHYTPLASGWTGDSLVLSDVFGLTVDVPLASVVFRSREDPQDATLLTKVPPPVKELVATLPARAGALYYRELAMAARDSVRLHAVVQRLQGGGGYREAPPATNFRARPDLGRITLVDRSVG